MSLDLTAISRRKFLSGTLAAGAGLLLPGRSLARRPRCTCVECVDPNRWVLLSDTHIWQHRDRLHSGVKPAENLAAARRQIAALWPRPSGVILSGDSVYLQGQPGDYAVLAEELSAFERQRLPVHVALGNHDNLDNFYAAFPDARPVGPPCVPGEHVTILETPRANWFLLDSLQKTDFTPGRLGEAQLRWLAEALDQRPCKPALLVAHHTPAKGGPSADPKKESGLVDTEALFEVITPRRQVKAYFFGHSHEWRVLQRDGIHLVNVPAVAWLFDPKQPRGWLDVQLGCDGATVVLHALDEKHPKHLETVELEWREGPAPRAEPCAPSARARRRRARSMRVGHASA